MFIRAWEAFVFSSQYRSKGCASSVTKNNVVVIIGGSGGGGGLIAFVVVARYGGK